MILHKIRSGILILVGVAFTLISCQSNDAPKPGSASSGNTTTNSSTAKSPSGIAKVNQPPVIDMVNVLPDRPGSVDTLSVSATAKDPDGDPTTFSYQWIVNGQALPGEVQTQLTPGQYFKGDRVTCEVTASDGQRESAPVRAPDRVVQNSLPQITAMTLTPEKPGKNTGVTLDVQTRDPDGDPVTLSYRWVRNKDEMTEITGPTIDGQQLRKGTYVACEVTASDGYGETKKRTDPVAISNSAPTISSAPAKLEKGSIQYTYKVNAVDPDGDAVTYTAAGPAGVTITPDGTLTWKPLPTQEGKHTLRITATDKEGASVTQEFDVTVTFEKPS